jgi:hypothetical protein
VILENFDIASVLTFQGGVFVPSYAAAKAASRNVHDHGVGSRRRLVEPVISKLRTIAGDLFPR